MPSINYYSSASRIFSGLYKIKNSIAALADGSSSQLAIQQARINIAGGLIKIQQGIDELTATLPSGTLGLFGKKCKSIEFWRSNRKIFLCAK